MQTRIDLRTILTSLLLPLLYWTAAVIAISLFGYPGVVCMTPVAWVLALPVGTSIGRTSESPGNGPILEGLISGGLMGFWQGVLFAAVMAVTPYLPAGGRYSEDLPSPVFVAILMSCLGIPMTAGLSALMAWVVIRKRK